MPKYFFLKKDSEMAYSKEYIKDQIRKQGFDSLKVFTAKRETNSSHFFCNYFGEVGEVGEGCGKECTAYNPRNGKSGICKHYRNCYTPDKEVLISA